jgi:DNA repair protein RecN (Recombination protein N)
MKIASGGELARFMLALKVVLADRGSAPTLVFDEIDTGAGGAVADAIGQRLARLASRVQVLAVTHAPQVAARARGHFRIIKPGRAWGQSHNADLASRRGSAARGDRAHAGRCLHHRRGAGRRRAAIGRRAMTIAKTPSRAVANWRNLQRGAPHA